MLRRAGPLAVVALLLAGAFAGCLARSPPTSPADARDADLGLRWTERATTALTFGAAAAIPYESVTHATDDGDLVTFPMLANATVMHVYLNASGVNASRAGLGYATFVVEHGNDTYTPDGEYIAALQPYGPPLDTSPRERSHVQIRDPGQGLWSVSVWPKGATVNQVFDLTLVVSGAGRVPHRELSLHVASLGGGLARLRLASLGGPTA
ncbi:MAG: hypothetical protein ACYDCK_02305 [Thermoplasmatota archaeon]